MTSLRARDLRHRHRPPDRRAFHGFSRSAAVRRGLAESVPGVKGVPDHTQPMPTGLFGTV